MYPQYASQIEAASRRFGIRPELLEAVIERESAGDYRAVSPAGAQGLMQIMPGTYSDLRGRYPDLSEDVFDPASNIMAGAAYLSEMGDRYGNDPQRMLIGYNAGPGRADQFTGDVSTLPQETQGYLEALMPVFQQYSMGQDVGYAPGMIPQGIMGPPPPQTALTIPPMATGAPAMLPTAQAPQAQGQGIGDSLSSFITDNPMALMAMGLGLLGAGPGQSPFAAGAQGFMSGMQMDRATAARTQEEERQRALQQLLAQSGMDPATAQLAGMFPEQAIGPMLERQMGRPSMFQGTGWDAQAANIVMQADQLQRQGLPIPPEMQTALQLIQEQNTATRPVRLPDGSLAMVPGDPSALVSGLLGQEQGIAGPAQPQTALTMPPAPMQPDPTAAPVAAGDGPRVIAPAEDEDRYVSGEQAGRFAAMMAAAPELGSVADALFPEGIDGPIDQGVRRSMIMGLPWSEGQTYNQMLERVIEPLLRIQSGGQTPEPEVVRYNVDLYGVSWRDSPEDIRNKLLNLERFINSFGDLASSPIRVAPSVDLSGSPTRTADDIIQQYGLE